MAVKWATMTLHHGNMLTRDRAQQGLQSSSKSALLASHTKIPWRRKSPAVPAVKPWPRSAVKSDVS